MEDDEFYDDDPRLECDCPNEDYNLLEGTARCFACGRARSISKAELTELLQAEADYFEMLEMEHVENLPLSR